MSLTSFLAHHQLNNSLLLGFYGGGNYGDELLMEVLAGLMQKQGAANVRIAYQRPESYAQFHHDFGFARVPMHNKRALFAAIRHSRAIVVGGGGLWGMDVNLNVFLMSLMLFISRRLLGKKVYLLAVGYYSSASRLGRISAWLAGKAANEILARDEETYQNFARINKHTQIDSDIAWYIKQLDLTPYQPDLAVLERKVRVVGRTLFITLRRFRGSAQDHLVRVTADYLRRNTDKPVIVALMEPQHVDPAGYKQLQMWQEQYKNVQILDFACNPLALFLFFQKHHRQLVFIGPQFHGILSAHLNGVPYMPVVYDNKVRNLLVQIDPDAQRYPLESLRALDVQRFIDQAYGKA